jgi:lysyl-tRNA synthetase class 1
LFDEYDRTAQAYWDPQDNRDKDLARIFVLSQVEGTPPQKHFLPRFRDVARELQDPKVKDLEAYFAGQKGSPLTKQEQVTLTDRITYAKIWLKGFAPQEEVVSIVDTLPDEAKSLSQEQKQYLQAVSAMLTEKEWQPEDLQQALYEKSKELNLPAKQAFGAIYLSLLGKPYGPKAAWLMLDHQKQVIARFSAVVKKEA